MFNGIIINQATIQKIEKKKSGINLFLKSDLKVNKKNIGISIACDGVCLTLISFNNKIFEFYLSKETIRRSKFQNSKIGDKINVELPLKFGSKISGHICQGHVDTVAYINKIIKQGKARIYDFKINKNFKDILINKASILVNGVSLTISKITRIGFQIWLIPHTIESTNLSTLKKGELVNIEIDILSKYVKKYLNEKQKI
tara:strand:- start:386 stop:985 length:600 start_codon:yes stop_codon:yes gene_type:complete